MKKSNVILFGFILLSVAIHNGGLQETSDIERQINYFERILNDYFRGDPRQAAVEVFDRLLDDYNNRIDDGNNEMKAWKDKLDVEFASLGKLKQQIDRLGKELETRPPTSDEKAIKEYDANFKRRNTLIDEYNDRGQTFGERQEQYRKASNEFSNEAAKQNEDIEDRKTEYYEFIEAYDAWFNSGKDAEYFLEINRLYSNLVQESRRDTSKQELTGYIERTRALRNELGEIVSQKELAKENGALIVKAIFPGNEPCYMILDTGATRVTFPIEIAEVLGLSDKLGNEIETGLAGGKKTRGRSVIIPSLTVAGKTANNIDGIILPAPDVGTDGLLGMSFLKNFLIDIDTERTPQVILRYKRR